MALVFKYNYLFDRLEALGICVLGVALNLHLVPILITCQAKMMLAAVVFSPILSFLFRWPNCCQRTRNLLFYSNEKTSCVRVWNSCKSVIVCNDYSMFWPVLFVMVEISSVGSGEYQNLSSRAWLFVFSKGKQWRCKVNFAGWKFTPMCVDSFTNQVFSVFLSSITRCLSANSF